MPPDKLVMMANQIAAFFASQPGDDRAERVAAHINDYWAPAMRDEFVGHVEAGATGVAPLAVEAARFIRRPAEGAGSEHGAD